MKFVLIYISPNGTTENTTIVLKNVIKAYNHEVELVNIGKEEYRENHKLILKKLENADIVGFGSPAYHMEMVNPMKELFHEMLDNKNMYPYKFKTFLYLNYGGITSGKAFINTYEVFKKIEIQIVGALKVLAPHFHHPINYPSENTKEFIENFYKEMEKKEFKSIDYAELEKIFKPEKLRVNLIYPLVHYVGKRRELPIIFHHDRCKKCKKCIKECPTGMLSLDKKIIRDSLKCIHCYHCVVTCPFDAVESPIEKIDEMIRMNKKVMGVEIPSNKMYI